MAELELIGGALSNFVWTCRMALAEKGVPYKSTGVMPHTPKSWRSIRSARSR